MTIAYDLQEQLETIDIQMLRLLRDRARLYAEMGEGMPDDADTLAFWTEEAAEMGLDELATEKIAKICLYLCKKEQGNN